MKRKSKIRDEIILKLQIYLLESAEKKINSSIEKKENAIKTINWLMVRCQNLEISQIQDLLSHKRKIKVSIYLQRIMRLM